MTTAKVSTRAQNEVIRIHREHRETGLFELKVMTWDAIEILLHEYPDVRELTYGPAPNESRPGFMRDYRKTQLVVIRARKDLRFVRYVSQPIDPDTGLCSDHIGRLRGFYSRKAFPDKLHLMRFYDSVQDRRFCFLTNHLLLSALTIYQLYTGQ